MNTTKTTTNIKVTKGQWAALPGGGMALVNCIDWSSSEGRMEALKFAPLEVMERYKPLEERNITMSLKGTERLTRGVLDFLESQLQDLRAVKRYTAAAHAAEAEPMSDTERTLRQALGEMDSTSYP